VKTIAFGRKLLLLGILAALGALALACEPPGDTGPTVTPTVEEKLFGAYEELGIYPQAVVTQGPVLQEPGLSVTLWTPDEFRSVKDYYVSRLPSLEWAMLGDMAAQPSWDKLPDKGNAFVVAVTKNGIGMSLGAAGMESGGSQINISIYLYPRPLLEQPIVTSMPISAPPPYVPLELTPGLREFAQRLDQALRTQDIQFFLDNVKFVPTRCDVPFGWPAGCVDPIPVAEGEKPRGVFVGDRLVDMVLVTVWQSEGFGMDRVEFEPFIRQFVLSSEPTARDQYGDGLPKLYAVSRVRDEYRETGQDFDLIATSIAGPRLGFSYLGSEEGQRSMLSFGVEFDGSRWWIGHLTQGPFLDGDSADARQMLESWQRWPA